MRGTILNVQIREINLQIQRHLNSWHRGADVETDHVAEGDADTNEEESVPPATTPLQGEGGGNTGHNNDSGNGNVGCYNTSPPPKHPPHGDTANLNDTNTKANGRRHGAVTSMSLRLPPVVSRHLT